MTVVLCTMMTHVSKQQKKAEKVGLGKRIEIAVNGEFQCWDIVRPEETSSLDKKISVDDSLIKLIFGLQAGEEVKGKIGMREVVVKIREVYRPTNLPRWQADN